MEHNPSNPRSCERCVRLCASRTQVVLPTMPRAQPALLCIGEAPGAEEDAQGAGFVGRAGRILRGLLEQEGIGEENVGFANVVRCRPPGNAKPSTGEIDACADYLAQTLQQAAPRVVLLVGGTAANLILGKHPMHEHIARFRKGLQHTHDAHLGVCAAVAALGERTLWVPMPHTSGLAWNRPSPFGVPWSVVGREQVRAAAKVLRNELGAQR